MYMKINLDVVWVLVIYLLLIKFELYCVLFKYIFFMIKVCFKYNLLLCFICSLFGFFFFIYILLLCNYRCIVVVNILYMFCLGFFFEVGKMIWLFLLWIIYRMYIYLSYNDVYDINLMDFDWVVLRLINWIEFNLYIVDLF